MQWGVNKLERMLLLWHHDKRVFNEYAPNEVSRKSKSLKKKNLNYTWLVPLEYYIYILYYEDDDDHRETFWAKWAIDHRRYMILNWMWNKSKARTSFWEVSLLWCPGGPFADWPSMSSPHCWGAQCSKKSQKVVCLLSLILGTVSVKQWRKNKY